MKILVAHTTNAVTSEKTETYRVEVRAASYLDRIHYYELVREATKWLNEQTGKAIEDDSDDPIFLAMRNLVYFRAEMLCAVNRERTAVGNVYLCEWKQGTGEEYERKTLPAEWISVEGMSEKMPPALLDEWLAATRQLNAGVLPTIPDFFSLGATTSTVIE